MKEETWKEQFDRRVASGELVPMGNGRYIDPKLLNDVIRKTNERITNSKIDFLGEFEHIRS